MVDLNYKLTHVIKLFTKFRVVSTNTRNKPHVYGIVKFFLELNKFEKYNDKKEKTQKIFDVNIRQEYRMNKWKGFLGNSDIFQKS